MTAPPKRLYHFPAARTSDQLRRMQELEAAEICRFCPDAGAGGAEEAVVYRGEWWYVMPNEFPYPGTSEHYLIVARPHVTAFEELPDEAGAELWAIKRKFRDDADPKATVTVERSGDMAFNGGSVAHLHVHFLAMDHVPDTPVRFRVSGHPAGPRRPAEDPQQGEREEPNGDR